jgi:hypothetical protein
MLKWTGDDVNRPHKCLHQLLKCDIRWVEVVVDDEQHVVLPQPGSSRSTVRIDPFDDGTLLR